MYFPFVFGRRCELLALRAIAKKYTISGRVVPLIEPVVSDTGDLIRCLKILGKAKTKAVVILNPHQGDFKKADIQTWWDAILPVIVDNPTLIPAFQCSDGVPLASAQAFLRYYTGRWTALVYSKPTLADAEVSALLAEPNVAFHIVLNGQIADSQQALLPKDKLVEVVDRFNKQKRNSDYGVPELFSKHHHTYKQVGIGFGDYTVIGSKNETGGGKPGAVAIHSTYKHPTAGDIWVHHFVSDDTDIESGTAESKYLEAVDKLVPTTSARLSEFGSNSALDGYAADKSLRHFCGLGKNKERQIVHHIAVVHDILHSAL